MSQDSNSVIVFDLIIQEFLPLELELMDNVNIFMLTILVKTITF